MKKKHQGPSILILFAILLSVIFTPLLPEVATAKTGFNQHRRPIVIKMATLAPNGSSWHELLKEMAADWSRVSDGQIKLRIYPGGVAGNGADMVRKMRIGQLHAALLTNDGLSRITPAVDVLGIPMAVDSWDGLDRVRQAMAPRLEALMAKKGFIVLNWGYAGWVQFFVPMADPSVETVQKAKLFVTSGNDRTIEIWKAAGFNVVPLAPTDILPGLQTGMINAYNATAVIALASQWFPFTPYMIDMPWAPMVGGIVISKRTWKKIPQSLKPQIKQIAENIGKRLRTEIQKMEEDALMEMQKRGLKIIKPTEQQIKHWQEIITAAYPRIRGPIIPEDWFDEAMQVAKSGKNDVPIP